jgi:hypothetical protein
VLALAVAASSCTGGDDTAEGPSSDVLDDGGTTAAGGASDTTALAVGTTPPPVVGETTSSGPTTTSPRIPALEAAVRLSAEMAARMGVALDGAAQSCTASVATGRVGMTRLAALPGTATIADLTQPERDAIADALASCVPPAAVALAFAASLELPDTDADRSACVGRRLLEEIGVGGLVSVADSLAAGVAPSAEVRSAARRAEDACPVEAAVTTTSSA